MPVNQLHALSDNPNAMQNIIKTFTRFLHIPHPTPQAVAQQGKKTKKQKKKEESTRIYTVNIIYKSPQVFLIHHNIQNLGYQILKP